jgi:uncharacterized protein YegL
MVKFTQIVVVLDRSGSMGAIAGDTIGGFNQFLKEQKKLKGKAKMSLVLFDHEYEPQFHGIDIQEVKDLNDNTFVPRGTTALLDAVGKTINTTYSEIKSTKKSDRPEQVVFVVVTDGYENASREFSREAIFNMITEMKEKDKWQFVFLGADQNAIKEGGQYGFDASTSLSYSSLNTWDTYGAVSDKISAYRSTGDANSMKFTDEDRKKAVEKDSE